MSPMNPLELLEHETEIAFADLLQAIEGVDERLSYATLQLKPDEYLHSNGSIIGLVQHIACCKAIYASVAFRNVEIKWGDLAEKFDMIGQSWEATIEDLHASHRYWLDAWKDIAPGELDKLVRHQSGKEWPAWEIITLMHQHDQYHAGQIEILKVSLQPTDAPPEHNEAHNIREYCRDSPFW